MAASRQQGSYLMVFFVAFTAFVAGLIVWSGHSTLGGVLTFGGLLLLAYSLLGLRRIKRLEFTDSR